MEINVKIKSINDKMTALQNSNRTQYRLGNVEYTTRSGATKIATAQFWQTGCEKGSYIVGATHKAKVSKADSGKLFITVQPIVVNDEVSMDDFDFVQEEAPEMEMESSDID